MATEGVVTGNVLVAPSQKMVPTRDGQTKVTELLVMSDVWKYVGEGEDPEQDIDKSSPVAVTIWNKFLGDDVMRLIRKGMRVDVTGEIHLHTWTPSAEAIAKGNTRSSEMRCSATRVTLALNRVEAIAMVPRRADAGSATGGAGAPLPAPANSHAGEGTGPL
jgi:single-stranded DNA-binding protein